MDFRKHEKTRKSYLAHENDSYDASFKLKQFAVLFWCITVISVYIYVDFFAEMTIIEKIRYKKNLMSMKKLKSCT